MKLIANPTVHGLAYLIEPSLLDAFDFDVVYFERGGSIQHTHVVGTTGTRTQAHSYAHSLAMRCGEMIMQEIQSSRCRTIESQI